MTISKEAQENINQLQLLEQNGQAIAMQKQQFQSQLFELESALSELEKTDSAYKIVGNIMVSAKKEDLKKDLMQKKEIVDLRLTNLEKQEKEFREKEQRLREEVMAGMKNG